MSDAAHAAQGDVEVSVPPAAQPAAGPAETASADAAAPVSPALATAEEDGAPTGDGSLVGGNASGKAVLSNAPDAPVDDDTDFWDVRCALTAL